MRSRRPRELADNSKGSDVPKSRSGGAPLTLECTEATGERLLARRRWEAREQLTETSAGPRDRLRAGRERALEPAISSSSVRFDWAGATDCVAA